MLGYCPHCVELLPEKLIDGIIFCPACSRMIKSNMTNTLVSAYRVLKKNKFCNHKQLKFELQLSQEELDFLLQAFEDEMSVEEFSKKLKNME